MIDSPHNFRILLAAVWITTIIGAGLDFLLESSLPEPLRAYLSNQMEKTPTLLELIGLAVAVAALGFMIQGSVRLYRLNINGRRPFLVGVVLSIVGVPLFGPAVYNGWSALLYEASMVLAGVVVGWAYLDSKSLDRASVETVGADSIRPPPIA